MLKSVRDAHTAANPPHEVEYFQDAKRLWQGIWIVCIECDYARESNRRVPNSTLVKG